MGKFSDGAILVIVDLVRLYPHIPHDEGLTAVRKGLNNICESEIPTNDIIDLAELFYKLTKMLSYLDYLMFLQALFCTEQLYCFLRIIFSMFLQKKKLKITCPSCMGYRLTKIVEQPGPGFVQPTS